MIIKIHTITISFILITNCINMLTSYVATEYNSKIIEKYLNKTHNSILTYFIEPLTNIIFNYFNSNVRLFVQDYNSDNKIIIVNIDYFDTIESLKNKIGQIIRRQPLFMQYDPLYAKGVLKTTIDDYKIIRDISKYKGYLLRINKFFTNNKIIDNRMDDLSVILVYYSLRRISP